MKGPQWPTALFLAVEAALGMPLEDYLEEARSDGCSFRQIARLLTEDSGVRVTDPTVQDWLRRYVE